MNDNTFRENAIDQVRPAIGEWFEVNPLAIDRRLFNEERTDKEQERVRLEILDAFERLKRYPGEGQPFKTLVPSKPYSANTRKGLQRIACQLGEYVAEYNEKVLEWAQRLANGETWEDVCNKPDPRGIHVIFSNGVSVVAGLSRKSGTKMDVIPFFSNDLVTNPEGLFPMVVSYDV